MKTPETRWQRMRELFDQATQLPTGQRESFIDRTASDDETLRDELKSLLAADECQKKRPLTDAIGNSMDRTVDDFRKRLIGSQIGDYRLKRLLGHGGVGSVYLAEYLPSSANTARSAAHVAIKIVEGAVARPETRRRFRDERQILANLNHPNIARLFDAGDTPQGYPYLVMDLVEGMPIDRYCDRYCLSVEDRIRLFLQVCSAVQCAHDNLIVHRDLKPGNILVTSDGTPKLLDFGIAKMLSVTPADDEPSLTRMKDQMLTPEYASPEQIRGERVTTASDVYSLGIVLYELLTGLRPYRIAARNQLELERSVCAADAAKPSTAVRRAILAGRQEPFPTRNIDTIAEFRKLTAVRLRTKLSGDLDAILLKALRKEPDERYSSAQHLAADLQRHLDREPVEAKHGHWSYYASRFVRKHAVGVGLAAAFVALLTGSLTTVTTQLHRLVRERDLALEAKRTSDQVASFMINVFDASDNPVARDREITAKELLNRAARRITTDLTETTLVKAQLLEAVGFELARQEKASTGIPLIEEAVAIRQKLRGDDAYALAKGVLLLGRAHSLNDEMTKAREKIARAITLFEKSGDTQTADYADAWYRLGTIAVKEGRIDEALQHHNKAIALWTGIYGRQHPNIALALTSVGNAYIWTSDANEAEQALRDACSIFAETAPELHPNRVEAERLLANALILKRDFPQATKLLASSAEKIRRVHGENSVRYANALDNLAEGLRTADDLTLAERHARQALTIALSSFDEQNYQTAYFRVSLAVTLNRMGQFAASLEHLTNALETYRETLDPAHMYIRSAEHHFAEALSGIERNQEAIEQSQKTISLLAKSNASPWRIARTENTLGYALFKLKNFDKAKPLLESSYQTLSSSVGPDPYTIRLARERLENFYAATGNAEKLAELSSQASAKAFANEQ